MYNSHGPRPSSVSGSNYAAKAGSSSLLCLASSLPGSHSQKTGPFQFLGFGNPINDNKGEHDGVGAGEEGSGDRGILDSTRETQLPGNPEDDESEPKGGAAGPGEPAGGEAGEEGPGD